MRRIFITPAVMRLAETYRDNLFVGRQKNFKQPVANLIAFRNELVSNKGHNWRAYAEYVDAIITHFREIITLKPSQFENYLNTYFSMLSNDDIKSPAWKSHNRKAFYEQIVDLMRYDEVRSSELIPYIEKLGLRTCVYCNSQYTVTTHVSKTEVKGGYQLDHFFPKSVYPFLCISFFNLQPSCGCCNNWKGEQRGLFNLYTDDWQSDKINPFSFHLTNSSMVRYMLKQDAHELELIFDCTDANLLDNHEELFHISKLYENFKDEAEELIWKKKVNNTAFQQQLEKMFLKKFPYLRGAFNRYLYGLYDQEKDIHKRPLTKMKQDLARQLHLI